DYVTHDITDANPEEIMRFYAQVDLAVGLRGHAQMIPFGLRRPIVSVISHDQLGFFLEDIGHPHSGGDIADPAFTERLTAAIDRAGRERERIGGELAAAQETIWAATRANVGAIVAGLDR